MARFFKKRRGAGGPSKNEEKVRRAANAALAARSGASLGARFPNVGRLSLKLVFLNPQGAVLDEKSVSLGTDDVLRFTVPCPGRCGTGSFDFSAKLEQVVTAGLPSAESSGKCLLPIFAGSAETCGCELKCRIEVAYLPAPAGD